MTDDKHKILAIAHRICPALAQTAVGFGTKEELVRATTRSLAASLAGFDGAVRLFVILDGCPSFRDFFTEAFAPVGNVQISFEDTPSIGNQATYARQFEILLKQTDADYLYFSEDDYIYYGNAFAAMADFLNQKGVDFITPLDHPDRYNHALGNKGPLRKETIRVSRHCHWRTAESSCMTFMTTRRVFAEAQALIATYGTGAMDGTMWVALTKTGVFNPVKILSAALAYILGLDRPFVFYMPLCAWKHSGIHLLTTRRFSLWQPIPTLAVHLSRTSLPLHSEDLLAGLPEEERMHLRDMALEYLAQP